MGRIRLTGATSGYTELRAANAAGNNTIILPTTNGGEVIVSDSSGNVNIDSGTFYVDASNNRVGVGTSSPNVPLQVIGGATVTDPVIRATNTGGTQSMALMSGGLRMDGGAPIQIFQGGSEVARIDTSGRLGVGTTSPVSAFKATFSGDYGIRIQNQDANQSFINLGVDPGNGYAFLDTDKSGSGTALSMRFAVNAAERMRIDTSGRVGIGTSSPNLALHVSSGTAAGINNVAILKGGGSSSGNGAGLVLSPDSANTYNTWLGSRVATAFGGASWGCDLVLSTNNNSAADNLTERMRITSAGNVGIGTTPLEKFHVNVGTNQNITFMSGGAGDARIQAVNDAGSGVVGLSVTASPLIFRGSTGGEVGRWDASGRLLVGTSSAFSVRVGAGAPITPQQQLGGTNGVAASFVQGCASTNDAAAAYHWFAKFASSTIGDNTTIVADNEILGGIGWSGSDGVNQTQAALIAAFVDGTPGVDDMPSRLVFSVTRDGQASPTERLRISNAGTVQVYDSSSNGLNVRTESASGTGANLIGGYYSATNTTTGTNCFAVFANGNVQNTNNSYGALSDIKLKENIVDAGSQWSDIKALQVRKYNFKEGQTHTQIGLVAQEAELVSPGLVSESPDRDAEGNDLGTVTKSVNYSVLYMKAVKALQEAMERIETLEVKVAALESA